QNVLPTPGLLGGGNAGTVSTVHGPRLPLQGKVSHSVAENSASNDKSPPWRSIESIGGVPRISSVEGKRSGRSSRVNRWNSKVCATPTESVGSAIGTPVAASVPRISIAFVNTAGTKNVPAVDL